MESSRSCGQASAYSAEEACPAYGRTSRDVDEATVDGTFGSPGAASTNCAKIKNLKALIGCAQSTKTSASSEVAEVEERVCQESASVEGKPV